jgi:hypothetical protein
MHVINGTRIGMHLLDKGVLLTCSRIYYLSREEHSSSKFYSWLDAVDIRDSLVRFCYLKKRDISFKAV